MSLSLAMMCEQHQKEMSELTDIMFAMEQNTNEREGEAKTEFQSMRDEIKNKVFRIFTHKDIHVVTPEGEGIAQLCLSVFQVKMQSIIFRL